MINFDGLGLFLVKKIVLLLKNLKMSKLTLRLFRFFRFLCMFQNQSLCYQIKGIFYKNLNIYFLILYNMMLFFKKKKILYEVNI